jgi:hypothetical protein
MANLGTSETGQESLAVDGTATLCQADYWESRIKTAWANASRHKSNSIHASNGGREGYLARVVKF